MWLMNTPLMLIGSRVYPNKGVTTHVKETAETNTGLSEDVPTR